MATYSPGDRVYCLVKDSVIVNYDEAIYDFKYIFDIVSIYAQGYMAYVPVGITLTDSLTVLISNFEKFNMDKKFIGSIVYYITDYKIVNIYGKLDGLCCVRCGEFYPMAVANFPDGTLKCWLCRNYKYR
jgi:hypothetical protein